MVNTPRRHGLLPTPYAHGPVTTVGSQHVPSLGVICGHPPSSGGAAQFQRFASQTHRVPSASPQISAASQETPGSVPAGHVESASHVAEVSAHAQTLEYWHWTAWRHC